MDIVPSFEEKDNILQDLGFNSNTGIEKLEINFGSSTKVNFGNNLELTSVQVKPNVNISSLKAKGSNFLTLAMVDPDVPSRSNPVAKVRF